MRRVRIRVTFESVEEIHDDSWDLDMCRFYFNDSLSCLNNRLEIRLSQPECTCMEGNVEVLGFEPEEEQ